MLESIVSTIINISAVVIVLHNISNRKLNFKDKGIYISFLLMSIFTMFNFIYVNSFLRLLISTIIAFLGNYIIFRDEIRKNLVSTLINQLIIVASELLYALALSFIVSPIAGENFVNYFFGNFVSNVLISIVMIAISTTSFIKKIYEKFFNISNRINMFNLIVVILILFLSINILVFMTYIGNSFLNIMILNILFLCIYSIIMYFAMNEKSKNVKFKQENEMLLDSLNDYEKMLDYQRVNNHENKNQLLVIRSMISKNNKKALDYLDEIITEKRNDDEGLYTYAKIIPEGGLQGLIYQKMLKMKENGINVNLDVDRKVRKVNFSNISSKVNYDLCRIVGIIIDNAIEEVIKLEDKEVLILMYKDENEFVIEVSNKCKTIPDISKLDEKGYTTKEYGHGYGLCLLKEIITNNDLFINERNVNKDIFTQVIKLKM